MTTFTLKACMHFALALYSPHEYVYNISDEHAVLGLYQMACGLELHECVFKIEGGPWCQFIEE